MAMLMSTPRLKGCIGVHVPLPLANEGIEHMMLLDSVVSWDWEGFARIFTDTCQLRGTTVMFQWHLEVPSYATIDFDERYDIHFPNHWYDHCYRLMPCDGWTAKARADGTLSLARMIQIYSLSDDEVCLRFDYPPQQ